MSLGVLHVGGFGHFSELQVGPLAGGLTVLHGPNEAGKTTLTAFLRFVLFGTRRGERPVALAGGRLGGRLRFDTPEGAWWIERSLGDPPVVRAPDGRVQTGDEAVRATLGGLDRGMYEAVFSFALADLGSFEALGEVELRERLFTGALAGAGRSVTEADRVLELRQRALWRPRAQSRIGDLEREIQARVDRLIEARRAAGELHRLSASLTEAEAAHPEAVARAVRLEREAAEWSARLEALPHYRAWRAALAGLEGMPEGTPVDDLTLAEVRRLEIRVGQAMIEAQSRAGRVAELEGNLAALAAVGPALAERAAIEALGRRVGELGTGAGTERATRLAEAGRRLSAALADAGLADATALDRLDLSTAATERLHAAADALVAQLERERRLAEATLALGPLTERAETARRAVEQAPRDEVGARAAPLVDALRRDAAATEAARVELERLRERSDALASEIEGLHHALGEEASSARPEGEAREGLEAEVRALIASRDQESARLAALGELRDQRRAERDESAAAMAAIVAPPALPDGASLLAERADEAQRALAALREARAAAGALERAREEAVARLAGRWTPDAIAVARTDAETCEALRAAARERQRAAAELAALPAAAPAPEGALRARTQEQLDAAEDALEAADRVLRALGEAHRRRGWAGARWAVAALVAGLALVLLGAVVSVLAMRGPDLPIALAGALVAGIGLIAAALAGVRLVASGASSPMTDLDRAALTAAGLGTEATSSDVDRLRAELRRERRLAELLASAAEASRERARREAGLSTAESRWRSHLEAAGWPPGLPADAAESHLAELLRLRDRAEEAGRLAARAREAHTVWTAWRDASVALCGQFGLALPEDERGVRIVGEAVRDALRRREAAIEALRVASNRTERAARELASVEEALRVGRERMGAIDAREHVARGLAGALGVPDRIELARAPEWLRRAAHLAELRAELSATVARIDGRAELVQAYERRAAEVLGVGLGLGEPGHGALDAAEARCRSALALEAAAAELERRLAAAEERLAEARSQRDDLGVLAAVDAVASSRWEESLAAVGAPPGLEPRGLTAFLEAARRARAADVEAGELLREQRAALTAEEAYRSEVSRLAGALGLVAPIDLAASHEVVRRAEALLTEEQARADERARVLAQLEHARETADAAGRDLALVREQLAELLSRFGVPDAQTLAREAAAHRDRAERRREADAHEAAVRHALRPLGDDVDPQQALSDPQPEAWRVAEELAAEAAQRARAEADREMERRGRLAAEIERVAASGEVAQLTAEQGSYEAELAVARRELAVLAVARHLLEATLQRFRDAHQPQVLRRAGELLAAATAGAYVGVEPDAEGRGLLVVDASHGRRRAEHLSTGTAELLFLVLRLGLAADLVPSGLRVPLVLDDVLVNLDPARARGVADLLGHVAAEHQVLLLTCRPESRDLLLERVGGATVIELPRFGGRDAPVGGTVGLAAAGADGGLDPVAQRVLDAIAEASAPLLRGEILTRAGVSSDDWAAAIGRLREAGLVTAEGAGRGTRYSLPG